MCDPTVIAGAGLAVQVGGSLLSHRGQNKQSAGNEREALKALRINQYDIGARQLEERQAAAGVVEQGRRATDEAKGIARASAAEAGLGGMSVDFLLADLDRQGAEHRTSVLENLDMTMRQLQRAKAGANATAQSRINSVPGANPLATALNLSGSVLGFADLMYARRKIG
jgi:hypothetical protein